MLLFALALCALTGPPTSYERQTVFPARTVTSPSGGWSLYFEPHTTNGLRGADYRMTAKNSDGSTRIARKGRHEYTLRDPIVTDRGWAYGWAIVHAPGEDIYANGGTVRIVALNSDGVVNVDDKIAESPPSPYCIGDWNSRPLILRVVPMEASSALAVFANCGEPAEFDAECWVYDFDDGKRSVGFVPFPSIHEGQYGWAQSTQFMCAIVVRESPLLLVQGWSIDWHGSSDETETNAYRERWAVFDVSGKRVFELADVDDRRIKDFWQPYR